MDKKSKQLLTGGLVRRNTRVWVIALTLFFFLAGVARTDDARLTNINITNNRDDLLLFFNLEGAFRQEMLDAVSNGVPTTFSYHIGLYRVRSLWFDRDVASLKLIHTLKYDNLKKEFVVKRSWQNTDPVKTESVEEAQQLMTEINSLPILPLDQLEKGRRYQIRVKAEVSKIKLPLYLHYVLFFLSFWDFETDWYTIDFIY